MLEKHDLQSLDNNIIAGNRGSGVPSVLDGTVGSTVGGLVSACRDAVLSHKEELNQLSQGCCTNGS